MSYKQIDPILQKWARRHDLQVLTVYKDYEVRMVRLYGAGEEFAGISVDAPSDAHNTVVRVGILRKPRRNSQHAEFSATLEDLNDVLEQAYGKAVTWLESSGKA